MGDWVLVIPVKRLSIAKSRLESFAGRHRAELALAFAADTLAAAATARGVCGVAVVTDEPDVAELARAHGLLVVGDEPDAGLNPALVHGAEIALAHWPGAMVAALSSDLPALRPAELALALKLAEGRAAGAAAERPQTFVADTAGTGTTLLAAQGLPSFEPHFGLASATAHRASGAHELTVPGLASLRRDVDTEQDLYEAVALGLGPASSAVVARIAQ